MSDAILAPYLHTEGAVSTEKKDIFTLENFDMVASCSSYNTNYVNGGYGTMGSSVQLLFNSAPSAQYGAKPTEWIQNISAIMTSSLCEISRAVLSIKAQLKSKSNMANRNNSIAAIGLGFTINNQAYPNLYHDFDSTNKFIAKFDGAGNATTSGIVSSEYSLFDIIKQDGWKNKTIDFRLISGTPNSSQWVYWTQASHSITINIIEAVCTIVYTDYR